MVDDAGDPEVPEASLPGPEQANEARPLNPADQSIGVKRAGLLALMIGIGVVVAAGVYFLVGRYPGPEATAPEVVVLIAGFVTVTLLLYLGSIILRALDLGAPAEALGMPPGSIRALIAMSLVLIFVIVGFVVFKSGEGTSGESRGITQAQIDQLRLDGSKITSQSLVTAAPGQPAPSAGAERYDVRTIQPLSPDAHDFGLQLLSIVSTLVVAVAGFYFGAQTVNQAGRETRAQLGLIQQARREINAAGVIGAKPDPALAAQSSGDPPDDIDDVDDIGDGDEPGEPPSSPIGDAATVDAAADGEPAIDDGGPVTDPGKETGGV